MKRRGENWIGYFDFVETLQEPADRPLIDKEPREGGLDKNPRMYLK